MRMSVILVAAPLALAACAQPFEKPGAGDADRAGDEAGCRERARMADPDWRNQPAAFRAAYRECMEARGWRPAALP